MKYLLILLLLFIPEAIYADGNVVKVKSTGKIIYRQSPDFKDGNGIKSALYLYPQYTVQELEEVLLNQLDFQASIKADEDKIKAENDAKITIIRNTLNLTDEQARKLKESL